MEKEFRKIIEGVKQIKLSGEEKQKMRESLRLFIEHNPVRERVLTRPQLQKRSSLFYQLRLRPMPVFAVIATIVLAAGGGTSFAAESALPGDVLYGVKVNVNEGVRGVLAVSDEAKAHLAAELAGRRLQEAAELVSEGRLTAEAQAQIESRFNAHVANFENKANNLTAKGKARSVAELSLNFEAALKAHGQILDALEAEAEGAAKANARVEARPLATAIQIGFGTVQETRAAAEAQVSAGAKADVEAAARGKMQAATNKIAEVRGSIERTKGSISASTTAEAEARLNLAEEAVTEGKAKLEAKAFAEAFASFGRAHRLAQETQLLVTASQRFKIDLDSSNKYKGCPVPVLLAPTMICPDGTTAGPSCEDGRWVIKQCPAGKVGTSTEETKTQGEGKFRLNFGF